MSSLLKNLLFALGLAVILWLGYVLFIQGDDSDGTDNEISAQASIEAQEFLVRLQALRSTRIDDHIFSDVRFSSLKDFREELEDEATGRVNPFAPIE